MKKIYKHPAAELVCLDMEFATMLTGSQENPSITNELVDDSQKTDETYYIWGTQL